MPGHGITLPAAERMREALNGRPPADRTRHDYQRVVNAYRSVYLGAPTSTKADPSVVAVAETLVEMGRRFEDNTILNKAIEQYKFLRREYPGSKYRADGCSRWRKSIRTISTIRKPRARRFRSFLRHYPRNRLADDARQAILEIGQEAQAEKAGEAQPVGETARSQKSARRSTEAAAESQSSRAALTKDESPRHSPAVCRE